MLNEREAKKSSDEKSSFSFFSKKTLILHLIFLFLIFLLRCDKTPVSSGAKSDDLKLLFYNVRSVTTSTATIAWSCSSPSQGYLLYGAGNGAVNTAFSIGKNKNHFVILLRPLQTISS